MIFYDFVINIDFKIHQKYKNISQNHWQLKDNLYISGSPILINDKIYDSVTPKNCRSLLLRFGFLPSLEDILLDLFLIIPE